MCFIALEGLHVSARSEQVDLLEGRLRGQGHDVRTLSFPRMVSPSGKAMRWLLSDDHNVFIMDDQHRGALLSSALAADFYAYAPEIRAHIARGGFMIVDRWIPSGLVYGERDGNNPEWLRALYHDLPVPDLTILLRVSVDEIVRVRELAGRYTSPTAIRALHDAYDRLWKANDSKAWITIDGSQEKSRITSEIMARIACFTRERGF